MTNYEEKKCGESCGCNTSQEMKKDDQVSNVEISKEKIEQDPTRFGDWQVNGRAIDFQLELLLLIRICE